MNQDICLDEMEYNIKYTVKNLAKKLFGKEINSLSYEYGKTSNYLRRLKKHGLVYRDGTVKGSVFWSKIKRV